MAVFLKYNDFQNKMLSLIKNLRYDSESFDVMLVAGKPASGELVSESKACNQESYQFQGAHKFILIKSSEKFRRILTQMSDQPKPCIYLHGVSQKSLNSLLDLMYLGQIEMMTQKDLNEFMEVAKEFEMSGNVCFGKPKNPEQMLKHDAKYSKTSKTKRLLDFDPSTEEIIKVPRLQKDHPSHCEVKSTMLKQGKRPAFKIKIRPFSLAATKNAKSLRRCSKMRNGIELAKNDKNLLFFVCPVLKCGRVVSKYHNLKSHFEHNHSDKSWTVWESKCKEYKKLDFAHGDNAIYEHDDVIKMHILKKSCKMINFHEKFKDTDINKIQKSNSLYKSVGYEKFYPCPKKDCGIILMKTSRRRHFQRRHPTHDWNDWSDKWQSYDLAAYKDGPSALFLFDNQSNRYELKKEKRFCNFHNELSIQNVIEDVQNSEYSKICNTEDSISTLLKETIFAIPQIADVGKDSNLSTKDSKMENLKRIFENAQHSEDIFN